MQSNLSAPNNSMMSVRLYCRSFPKVCARLPRSNLMFSLWNLKGIAERTLINIQRGILLHQRSGVAVVGESEQCEDRGGVLSILKLLIIFHKSNESCMAAVFCVSSTGKQTSLRNGKYLTASVCFHFNSFKANISLCQHPHRHLALLQPKAKPKGVVLDEAFG